MIADKKRKILEKDLGENSLLLLLGKGEVLRNGDVHYPFRQDSDFLLLTGAHIPDLRLICVKKCGETTWILYSDEITESEKIWGTSRLSHMELMELTGVMDIREMQYWKSDIESFAQVAENIYIREQDEKNIARGFSKFREKYRTLDLTQLRLIKLPEEIENMRKAISITHDAYCAIKNSIRPGMYEYEIEAEVASIPLHHATEAYPTIVASGLNACTLHYTRHEKIIDAGDLVLIDFGAEYDGYAADITRVFSTSPLSGRQQDIYNAVLEVKSFAESCIRPGVKKSEYEILVREKMNEKLISLGLTGNYTDPKTLPITLSRKYYPHSTSHFLGLDVHDVGSREAVFEPGMVITCEPGIYIPEEGIGIRLEDDILIKGDGCENLSQMIPV